MKKILALALALIMVLGLATTAYAADTYTLTLNGAQEGHTYTAYQIFAGDLSGDTLSNIVWGTNVNDEAENFPYANTTAAAVAETIKTTANAEAFAAAIAPYLTGEGKSAAVAEKATSCEITGLDAGYYLVKTTGVTETNDVYTYYIMKIVKDTSATIKADVPEIDKTVDDNDANIGDTVTFTLTATMPSNIQGYETYKLVFHDTMSAGLTFGKIIEVAIDDVKQESGYVLNPENPVTGEEFTVTFADVLKMGAKANSIITVKYTAVLNENAVIGTNGNPNEVYLEYSNNPNWDGEGDEPTGDTPKDEEKVYTWEIPVFKYTKNGETKVALAGAGFTLYDGDTAVKLTKAEGEGNIYKVDPEGTVTEIITDATGRFEIEGLEQGTYVLKETLTPAGYNTCEDITVVIGKDGVLTIGETTVTTVEILNQAGTTLPETGGMGTTIFYIIGGLLVAAAVVLLVTKKRMANAA